MPQWLEALLKIVLRRLAPPRPTGGTPVSRPRPGDVLLKRTDHWESYLIMVLDGGAYSHCGVCALRRDPKASDEQIGVLHCNPGGIHWSEIPDPETWDVYRLRGAVSDLQPVLGVAWAYADSDNEYSYVSLYLAAILMVTRLFFRRRVRWLVVLFGGVIMWQLHRLIDWLRRQHKVAFTCSEYVTHNFWDAGDDSGHPFGIELELTQRHAYLAAQPWREDSRLGRLRRRALTALEEVRPQLRATIEAQAPAAPLPPTAIAGSALLPAAIISPGDLQYACNLGYVGPLSAPDQGR